MKVFSRLLKHFFTTNATGRRTFPHTTLEAVQKAIAEGEKRHQGEIRLIVEPAMPLPDILNGISSRERARHLFSVYRIWDTEANTGILLYINLADHKVEIVADRMANRALTHEEWKSVCLTLVQGFRQNAFHDSTLAALRQLNDLLAAKLPAQDINRNELSNRPVIL
jgi:uncharacterized membrane protein